jgi:hypothetical protein
MTCAHREDLVAVPGREGAPKGLWTRLNSHASGRRAGDQFNVYICDRFIVPVLMPDQQRDIDAVFADCQSEPAVPCGLHLLAQLSEAGDGAR